MTSILSSQLNRQLGFIDRVNQLPCPLVLAKAGTQLTYSDQAALDSRMRVKDARKRAYAAGMSGVRVGRLMPRA